MLRVIIAGGRDFDDYETLRAVVDKILSKTKDEIQIVSGGARGADKLGEQYAKERGYDISIFYADWDRYGASAGYKRNLEMAQNADALIAFWDGESRGTKHMINLATERGLKVRVWRY